ncbi:MAG: electron transfer flavoprotein subunit alpha/FixB family protein [Acidobacteria bacterium]|nr:electron transfer flavoprotein subunit alpha/FixB family protein [Acidobacteriota bacterium]
MSKKIWIVTQHRDGKLHRMSREAIAAGQQLAQALGASAEAVILGSGIDGLAAEIAGYDLAAVHTADHAALADYTPGGYVSALAPALAAARPDFVVFPHTYQSVDYVPLLAQRVDAGLLPEVTSFENGDDGLVFTRPVLAGKMVSRVRVRGEGTVLLSVQSGAFSADSAATGSAPVAALGLGEVTADREILGVEEVAEDQVDLSKADVIVAVGRGIGGADKMAPARELAELLGAEIGASRPVIDSDWLPRDRQIGSSGQTVAPKLYIAIGISGAIQHLVGMKGSSVVVAINKDPKAPIFNVSDYGIVGDLHEVLPELNAKIRELKQAG